MQKPSLMSAIITKRAPFQAIKRKPSVSTNDFLKRFSPNSVPHCVGAHFVCSDYSTILLLVFASNCFRNFVVHYGAADVTGYARYSLTPPYRKSAYSAQPKAMVMCSLGLTAEIL